MMKNSIRHIKSINLLILCIFFISLNQVSAQVIAQDSLALVALYNNTSGESWTNNSGWLAGPVSEWYGIQISDQRINSITLNNNNLEGTIPPELGNLSNVTALYLQENQLTGNIPQELGRLSKIRYLNLSDNQLEGSIPDSLGNFVTLTLLHLANNQLSGNIPVSLGDIINIADLVLNDNQLDGNIPSSLGNINMQGLYLSGNQLTGSIPEELGNIENLLILYLQDNQLTGPIPANLYNLPNLLRMDLSDNQLSGTISGELASMTSLDRCYLNNNKLTGSIPPELGNAFQIRSLWLNDNQLGDSIPAQLANNYRIQEIYLQNNNFTYMADLSDGDLDSDIELKVENNFLNFDDLEANADISSEFTYAPQAIVGDEQNRIVYAGDSAKFHLNAGGTASMYHWFKDSTEIFETSDTLFVLKNVQIQDAAEYYCTVTNSFANDLTLYSPSSILNVIDTTAPSAPQNISATASDSMITLIWQANNEPDSGFYRIYLDTMPEPHVVVDSTGSIDDTTKALKGLVNNTTYYLRLTAVDWSGNESEYSDEIQAIPVYIDSIPPTVPQNLTGVVNDSSITLTWDRIDDIGSVYYRVYMDTLPHPTLLVDSTNSVSDTSITLSKLQDNSTYYFRVTAIDEFLNESDFSNEIDVTIILVGITEDNHRIPENFSLEQNYPNPFNPATTIRFKLAESVSVSIEIFNALGQKIESLMNSPMSSGEHKVVFDAANYTNGIYFYKITAGDYISIKKMILIK